MRGDVEEVVRRNSTTGHPCPIIEMSRSVTTLTVILFTLSDSDFHYSIHSDMPASSNAEEEQNIFDRNWSREKVNV